jgi:hypothetical protein
MTASAVRLADARFDAIVRKNRGAKLASGHQELRELKKRAFRHD